MMINHGINEVIADDFARDRGQRLSPVKNSGIQFDNFHHYQDTKARLQLVYQQIDEIVYLVCESHLNEIN